MFYPNCIVYNINCPLPSSDHSQKNLYESMHPNQVHPNKSNFLPLHLALPNLKKCYKYNEAACCTILHDDQIKDKTESLLPSSCLRKYPEFEDLLCLACAPLESVYYDSTTKIIKI